MIGKRLESAILDIDTLISLTCEDIEDIKIAKHETLGKRLSKKEQLINSFEQKKRALNDELLSLTREDESRSIEEILTEEEGLALERFKDRLSDLKRVNREYAKFVATISEFYNSLIDEMFTLDLDGYEKNRVRPATIFTVSA